MPSSHRIIGCPPELRPLALRRLHAELPTDQQGVLAQALEQIDVGDPRSWEGLLVAVEHHGPSNTNHETLEAVAWVHEIPGNTAVLWMSPQYDSAGAALLEGVAAYVDARRVPLTQMVVGERDGYSPALQERGGFPKFAELLYLQADTGRGASRDQTHADLRTPADLAFVARAGEEPQRLSALLEQTYVGTLDCPGLDGVRDMADVLEGYRAQGRYSADDWYFVARGGVDSGALILAEHADTGNWELVYMGLVPEARGAGIGKHIVEFALNAAGKRGAERLVLAVDKENAPALAVYRGAGFVEWDRRIVYARLQPRV